MDEQLSSQRTEAPARDEAAIRRLMIFFALVYIVEGAGQIGGLLAQPLSYFLKQAHGWTALQVTAYITIFNFPWIIKPIYGAISDFVPIFGYRRKSYLLAANVAAIAGFVWAAQLNAPNWLVWALQLTAYGMAISSTICGAVLVENGQRLHNSGRFVNQQWLWFNAAAIVGSILGGELVQWLPPAMALHTAALIVAVAPVAVLVGTIVLIPEQKTRIDLAGLKATFGGVTDTFRRRELWVIAFFLFLYYFSPGLGTPLYYTMTDGLKFSQGFIGILGSISAAGWVVGALLYRRLFDGWPTKNLLYLSIALGTLTTAAYVLLHNEASAVILSFCSGFAAMLATVATVTLAADFCPPRSEGFSFAVMMSVINLATSLANNVGSYLYDDVFHGYLTPLILVSAAFTAFAFVLVPLLHLGSKRPGQPVIA
ncbi:MAG TPA: MFS transporter [Xanthobacteraceae bacterium]|nr:MFS transporter [Xanthobacteraceae bacterium]